MRHILYVTAALAAGSGAFAQTPAPAPPADAQARKQMLDAWTSAAPAERQATFINLTNDDASLAALLTAVEENPTPTAVSALTGALAEFAAKFPSDPPVCQLFLAVVERGGPAVHGAVSAALKNSPAAPMADPILRIYGTPADQRPAAVGKVAESARQGDAPSLKALVLASRDQNPDLAQAATEWLAALAGTNNPALDEIRRLAADSQASFRRAAVASLGIGTARRPELLEILLQAARDTDTSVRLAAIIALSPNAVRRNDQATTAIANATRDPDSKIRKTAVEALGAALSGGNDKARAFLARLASSKDPELAAAARKALESHSLRKK